MNCIKHGAYPNEGSCAVCSGLEAAICDFCDQEAIHFCGQATAQACENHIKEANEIEDLYYQEIEKYGNVTDEDLGITE